MARYRIKKFLDEFIIIFHTVLLFFVAPVMALESPTHKAINEHVANKNLTFNGFSLHNHLQIQLGMPEGVETYFAIDNINKQVLQWLSDGGEYEDKPSGCMPFWRSHHHFHNPVDNSGFSGIWDTHILSGVSARDWAMYPVETQSCGYYSWNDKRLSYFWALAADSRDMRERYFAETFRGLGQLVHLVQDMSVPEHVRNDGHYFAYDYELWAKSAKAPLIANYDAVYYVSDSSFPLSVGNLFDTEQYNGTNPNVTLYLNIGLSEYTSANFLSPDSMFNKPNLPYPAYSETELKTKTDSTTQENKLYLSKRGYGDIDGSGERIEYLARAQNFYNYLPVDHKTLALTLNDPLVYGEYASKLIPRAIGYSSQLLGYFFRGQMEVAEIPVFDDRNEKLQALHVTVRNVTPTGETMKGDGQSGCLMLSWRYASSDGSGEVWGRYPYCVLLPKDLPYGKDGNGNAIDDDEHEATIVFDNLDQTQGAPIWKKDYPRVAFTLAYVGTLGNETMLPSGTPGQISISGAVIGKHFTPSLSIMFDEEWMTAPRGDHPVWYMSHDAAGGVADSKFCNNLSCSDPISCPDEAGRATDIVDPENGGSLIMTNTRYAKPSCDPSSGGYSSPHCNVALIGYHNLSGDVYNPFDGSTGRYVFPVEITKDSYLQISVDEMSVNPVPPASGYATAYQTVEFYFSHGYVLQYSVGDQFLYNPSPYVGSFYLDPGHINADNIYELFAMYDFPTPPPDLKLNNIRIVQQTFPDLPCNLGYTQTMKVDLIRIVEMKPFH